MKALKAVAILIATIIVSTTLANAEKQHNWEQGTVISQDLSSYNGGAVAMPIGGMIAAVPITRQSNTVVIETATATYTWSEIGNKTLILPVHGLVSFYRDGGTFIVLDVNHKKHKFALFGMTEHSPAEQHPAYALSSSSCEDKCTAPGYSSPDPACERACKTRTQP